VYIFSSFACFYILTALSFTSTVLQCIGLSPCGVHTVFRPSYAFTFMYYFRIVFLVLGVSMGILLSDIKLNFT